MTGPDLAAQDVINAPGSFDCHNLVVVFWADAVANGLEGIAVFLLSDGLPEAAGHARPAACRLAGRIGDPGGAVTADPRQLTDRAPGDSVGAIRRIGDDGAMRQRLLELSEVDRSFTYEILPGSPVEVANDRACLRIRPVIDAGQTFVEWSATFDCAPGDAERWRRFYAEDRFPTWLSALRECVAR